MKPVYESTLFQQISASMGDNALRPGGTDVTRRGLMRCMEYYGLRAGARALDLGCGPGASLSLLREMGFAALGLDRNRAFLLRGQSLPRVQGDVECLPLAAGSFDLILCECVLSLMHASAVFRGMARVLRPGGLVLFSDLFLRKTASLALSGETLPEMPQSDMARSGVLLPDVAPSDMPLSDVIGSSCSAGARPRDMWEDVAVQAGFKIIFFEDNSRALAQLAAQLLWYGPDTAAPDVSNASAMSGAVHSPERHACACGGTAAVGYGLWIARKETTCTP